jgi:D-serine dehydratase
MGFTTATLRLKEDYYKAILKNTTQKGWTECSFVDRAMKRTPEKQYCVNGDIIKDWKEFEKDIVKNEKCLNIYLWRGIDGVTYRLKFSEDNMKFSSINVTYALRPCRSARRE